MPYFFANLRTVEKRLNKASELLLFTDFDGTLASIQPTPQQANLSLETREKLKELSKKPNMKLIFVSGRSLKDLTTKIRLPNVIYAGCHGLEWLIENQYGRAPMPNKTSKVFEVLKKKIKKEIRYQDVIIKDKGLSFSIHYRLLKEPDLSEFKWKMKEIINVFSQTKEISVISGKKVYEIIPALRWNKGYFCKYILDRYRKHNQTQSSVYLGDDVTDEDAFLLLKDTITVKVGRKISSKAEYFLHDTSDVLRLLTWLCDQYGIK
ncbi:trehalose-phosphatase [Candidatus Gottesmanbacteria bacterium CG11_big_fil_rev_8_21_14_0_20_37_11]|uniref:Trehalose 6-phosphate phosphatase n=3 Tax=Candidatus Gottesmaniibacteriota TaxID=1752720 RepID=A0A2M7RRW5_9BACT|nr:MAG: trehalose-phosphatase [Candidatus Gottesmanbacteria bacterium CG1_02_37_22]PIP32398.1 MAG: trehalose-phosphatase [Candidatus Gottesmanbacteria bacterium CG23_combo_of_CG06-09_8_20_14_all_37_19]PIR07859.1 MAG: trehalose-phosphatase [Candidatus Gottesmanbacteria bacterium CG11_big_fil_rev_8_21_14_0_20_37_11]PIZ03043.1 MAG: trehalose-phosphatase [Candidatus Gottesmanbacteria bacterium CG_4_10_14_0_8_um_filter_37_24]